MFLRTIEYLSLIAIAAATLYYVLRHEWMVAAVLVMGFLVAASPHILNWVLQISMPPPFRVSLAVFMLSSVIVGERLHFYDRFWWWDLILHVAAGFGIVLVAVVAITLWYQAYPARPTSLFATFSAVTLSISMSALWELLEFVIDRIAGTNMQPTLSDTMSDLAGGVAAAIVAGYFGWRWLTRTDIHNPIAHALEDSVERNQHMV